MENFFQDVHYALHQLRKSPGFAVTAILILTLGIDASAAIFGVVDATLIKPLPYHDPAQLVEVTESVAVFPRANLSYPDYLDWKKVNQVFSSMDVYGETGFLLRTPSGTRARAGSPRQRRLLSDLGCYSRSSALRVAQRRLESR